MIENQKQRFQEKNSLEIIQNYLRDPAKYENEYLSFVGNESIAQYKDYFESDKDELDDVVLPQNKQVLTSMF